MSQYLYLSNGANFYELDFDADALSLTTRYGKSGSDGVSKTVSVRSVKGGQMVLQNQEKTKRSKGYRVVSREKKATSKKRSSTSAPAPAKKKAKKTSAKKVKATRKRKAADSSDDSSEEENDDDVDLADLSASDEEAEAEEEAADSHKVRLTFTKGRSNKFYEMSRVGASITTKYGRIGTKGTIREVTHKSTSAAQSMFEKTLEEKLKAGYVVDGKDTEQTGAAPNKVKQVATLPAESNAYVFPDAEEHEDNSDLPEWPKDLHQTEFYHFTKPLRNFVERGVDDIIHDILHKPRWHEKLQDANLVKKWKREASSMVNQEYSTQIVARAFQELNWLAAQRDGAIVRSPVQFVWQADGHIPAALTARLKRELFVLENIPEVLKDYHPGSDQQVLDLIHPSLFCYVGGRTCLVKTDKSKLNVDWIGMKGEVLPPRPQEKMGHQVFGFGAQEAKEDPDVQWLPCDIHVDAQGNTEIQSYINNLHPVEHAPLYKTIAEIFSQFVPLFNRTLSDLCHTWPFRVNHSLEYQECEFSDDDRYEEWEETKVPEPLKFNPYSSAKPRLIDLRGRDLQMIVKAANIELTPEKPSYSGGVWHVEGTKAESILATGIYYYDVENITESKLHFRHSCADPNYDQGDSRGVKWFYNVEDGDEISDPAGFIKVEEGRCITFPNTLQHCVTPFELKDTTKPGHRKILVFFLIDPKTEVISTSLVPPQQWSWLKQELDKELYKFMPRVIADLVTNYVRGDMMTLADAKRYREELMEVRSKYIKFQNGTVFEREFSLCEH